MKATAVKNRGVLFTENLPEWDLNLYAIIGNRQVFLIDTGLGPAHVSPVIDHCRSYDKQIILVNTHYHWDHVWGNCAARGSQIISHTLCREYIDTKWGDMMHKNRRYCAGDVTLCLPNLTFDTALHFPDEKIRLFHSPGHTADSISILDEQDHVLIAGDNIGDSDDNLVPSLACDKSVYVKTLEQYQSLEFDACISGHNTVQGRDVFDRILELLG